MGTQPVPEGLEIHPVTPERWDDLADLAGERGFTGCAEVVEAWTVAVSRR
jgi:hypothetical protein